MDKKDGMDKKDVKVSKYMSLILRHKPPESMDDNGYVPVTELLEMINSKFLQANLFTFNDLERIVDNNNKKRFAFNDDKTAIRASQGHSIEVNLELESETPPEELFHGTGAQFVNSIKSVGIQKRSRQHVHLSDNYATAKSVGSRHGRPVVIKVYSQKMHDAGYQFFRSANGVWLTDEVPTKYFMIMK